MSKKTNDIEPQKGTQPDKKGKEKADQGWIARMLHFVARHESEDADGRSARDILNSIDSKWVLRQLSIVAIIFLFAMASITCGYLTQTLQVKRNDLKREVEDHRLRALTRNSELTREMRQSMIEERLKANGDSTLTTTPDKPFIIERDTKK